MAFGTNSRSIFRYIRHYSLYIPIPIGNVLTFLNMFLLPIKLRTFKFSPYLILIGFLVLTKESYF